jgi:hypothetical protein
MREISGRIFGEAKNVPLGVFAKKMRVVFFDFAFCTRKDELCHSC